MIQVGLVASTVCVRTRHFSVCVSIAAYKIYARVNYCRFYIHMYYIVLINNLIINKCVPLLLKFLSFQV